MKVFHGVLSSFVGSEPDYRFVDFVNNYSSFHVSIITKDTRHSLEFDVSAIKISDKD
jgi:hypothetical protein